MNYDKLKLLLDSPAYIELSDEEIVDRLNALTETVAVAGSFINEKTLYSQLGAAAAESILQKLEAAAATNPYVKRALHWMTPAEQGIDLGNPVARGMIELLATEAGGNVFTVEEANSLKKLGEAKRSPAQVAGLPRVELGHVQDARRLQ